MNIYKATLKTQNFKRIAVEVVAEDYAVGMAKAREIAANKGFVFVDLDFVKKAPKSVK